MSIGYFASLRRSAKATTPAAASMAKEAPASAPASMPVLGEVAPVSAPDGYAADVSAAGSLAAGSSTSAFEGTSVMTKSAL